MYYYIAVEWVDEQGPQAELLVRKPEDVAEEIRLAGRHFVGVFNNRAEAERVTGVQAGLTRDFR